MREKTLFVYFNHFFQVFVGFLGKLEILDTILSILYMLTENELIVCKFVCLFFFFSNRLQNDRYQR